MRLTTGPSYGPPHVSTITDLGELLQVLGRVWGPDTAVDASAWSADRPSTGQCAVTALLIQELFGGSILRGELRGMSHYWNWLPSGEELDLTRSQFDVFEMHGSPQERAREELLSNRATRVRYELLKSRIDVFLSVRPNAL